MKKILIITMSLLLILGLVFACSCGVVEKEETPTPEVAEEETATPVEAEELWWKWPGPTSSIPSPEAEIPIINAHSQVGTFSELGVYWDLNKIMQLIDESGVTYTILMARGEVTPGQLVSFASEHSGRIIPAVRITSALYSNNDVGYYTFLRNQVNMHQFGAMGEVLMCHAPKPAAKGRSFPEVVIYPDDDRVHAALEYAIEKKWPFIAHIEFGAAGSLRDEFMTKFEDLLRQYPEHPFVLTHMGQLDCADVHRLIEAHDNIHFLTSWSNPVALLHVSAQPWTNMFDGNRLSADWKQLMIDHPDRFILAFDNLLVEHWGPFYLEQVALWREAIGELPTEVAHVFAHGNAERLWRLQLAE